MQRIDKVDKGVRYSRRRIGTVYPWDDMDIDDSFFVPFRPGETAKNARGRIASAASSAARSRGTRYTLRTRDDGVRVWRVE